MRASPLTTSPASPPAPSARLHAGYHPLQHPVAEIDATAGYELGACLACLWKGSPAIVTIATGAFFNKTLAMALITRVASSQEVDAAIRLPTPFNTHLIATALSLPL